MLATEKSDPVEKRCPDVEIGELGKRTFGMVQRGVEGGIGERLRQEKEDSFCAPALGDVVVHNCDRGRTSRRSTVNTHRAPTSSPGGNATRSLLLIPLCAIGRWSTSAGQVLIFVWYLSRQHPR